MEVIRKRILSGFCSRYRR